MARPQFLIPVVVKRLMGQDQHCPHCGGSETTHVGTKHLLLQLRRCGRCGLMFRWPKDVPEDNRRFYSGPYREAGGVTTNLPSPEGLREMCRTGFAGTDRDATGRLALLGRFKPSGALLDFGASWGYTSWQFARAGYDVIGFEVDRARAAYGREHLGLRMLDDPAGLNGLPGGSFDLIYTSHVLEHLPDLRETFDLFLRLLRPGGVLTIFVPNATGIDRPEVFARKKSFGFGEKHTFAFTAEFFERNLPARGFDPCRVDASPFAPIDQPRPAGKDLVEGEELMAIASKPVA
jgi:SAM-dependent methyltransferase